MFIMARKVKNKRRAPKSDSGTVYVLSIKLGDVLVYKVGMTTKTVGRRVLQIVESVYHSGYGYFPEVHVLYAEKTLLHRKVENTIHGVLDEYRWDSEYVFSGSTECFVCSRKEVADAYRLCIDSDEEAKVWEGEVIV